MSLLEDLAEAAQRNRWGESGTPAGCSATGWRKALGLWANPLSDGVDVDVFVQPATGWHQVIARPGQTATRGRCAGFSLFVADAALAQRLARAIVKGSLWRREEAADEPSESLTGEGCAALA